IARNVCHVRFKYASFAASTARGRKARTVIKDQAGLRNTYPAIPERFRLGRCYNDLMRLQMRQLMSGLALTAWLFSAAAVSADTIRLKDGEELKGKIVHRTATEVIVQFEFGTMSFSPEEVVAVEAEPLPERPLEQPSTPAPTEPTQVPTPTAPS